MRAWTSAEISTLKRNTSGKTDREIAGMLSRSVYSVRSFRVRNVIRRQPSHRDKWKGDSGRSLSRLIATEYIRGLSQANLVHKYSIEWRKLKEILVSYNVQIRDKSQQILIQRYGKLPRIRSHLGSSKLYIIFAMFGDGLRPSSQAERGTHIIGIAAGHDKEFAEQWARSFEKEYEIRPRILELGPNNIQAYVSSCDIWRDLHTYAVFGRRVWGFNSETLGALLGGGVTDEELGNGIRGFFDAEGSVKHQVSRSSRQVAAYSVNQEGLDQISKLLGRLHVGHRTYHNSIAIFGKPNLERFEQMVGFSIGRKHEALIRMIDTYQQRQYLREVQFERQLTAR